VWLRIAGISILLTVLIAYGVKRAAPALEFDWASQLALCIAALFFGLLCMFGLWWLVPPFIRINAKGVSRQEGQHVFWRRRADIRRITIDATDPARPRLCIEAAGKAPFESGIAGKVSTEALAVFLRETFPEWTVEQMSKK
jgi:hypothetical protein